MAAAAATSHSHRFPFAWANSAPSAVIEGCVPTRLRRRLPFPRLPPCCPSLRGPSSLLQLRRSPSSRWRCGAAASPPPEPPFGEDRDRAAGLQETFYRMQDVIRIFFAVFFWMALFFWASAWDGRDNIRPNKRSTFRRSMPS